MTHAACKRRQHHDAPSFGNPYAAVPLALIGGSPYTRCWTIDQANERPTIATGLNGKDM